MSIDKAIPYRHGEIPSTYSNVYSQNNRGIIQKSPRQFDTPPFSLFMFLCFPQFSPMTSPAPQAKKKEKKEKRKQARTHVSRVCVYSIVLKDELSFRKTPTPFCHGVAIKDLLLISPFVFL